MQKTARVSPCPPQWQRVQVVLRAADDVAQVVVGDGEQVQSGRDAGGVFRSAKDGQRLFVMANGGGRAPLVHLPVADRIVALGDEIGQSQTLRQRQRRVQEIAAASIVPRHPEITEIDEGRPLRFAVLGAARASQGCLKIGFSGVEVAQERQDLTTPAIVDVYRRVVEVLGSFDGAPELLGGSVRGKQSDGILTRYAPRS